jgi:hypothetical protein
MIVSTYLIKWHTLILLLGVSVLLPSCEWFKPARDSDKDKVYKDEDVGDIQSTRVYDPETGEWRTVREVNGKLDTVKWTDQSEDRFPPITTNSSWNNSGGTGGETPTPPTPSSGKAYNVSILLPFLAQNTSTTGIDDNSTLAIQYYAGAKLAYDDLKSSGVNLNISVMDSEGSTTKVNSLLRGADLLKSDLIVGPYKRENVGLVASFSKSNKIPQVVPFTAQMGVTENNPYYIQVNPSLKSHCEAITRHVRSRYRTDDVVLVALDNPVEKARLKFFQDANAAIEGQRPGTRFVEVLVGDTPAGIQKMNIRPYVREGKTTIFIVPSWSNESFIYSLLRQLMLEKSAGEDIIVYGMPAWMNYEQVDYEFFEKLKVHVSSASYTDVNDEKVRQFRRKFFNTYGTVPTDDAFLGYDVMLYFGRMVGKWGKDFYSRLDAEPAYDVLHGRFRFDRVVSDPSRSKENLNYYDQLENTFVHILQYRDYHFQPAE